MEKFDMVYAPARASAGAPSTAWPSSSDAIGSRFADQE
jgi:hypothetical protein